MKDMMRFIIPDCYTRESREVFDQYGVVYAGELYARLLKKHLPEAEYEIFFTSDPGVELPRGKEITEFTGVLWPGCNLTVFHSHDKRVQKLVQLAKDAYEYGVPQFGSCWAAQIAVYAAGGTVRANPKGREMGLARKIHLSEEGKKHPMMKGKPLVYDGFVSHDDIITDIPEGATILAGNDFAPVQAVAVKHKKGVFWATQYHPEYNLELMSNLIPAREEKLIKQGFFKNHEDMETYTKDLKAVHDDPSRKDLRWRYDIDDSIISDEIREVEFVNWLKNMILS
ncbi:MAG: type 1 glutamine amidotransferase [Spirochaetes bacterium]|nr:MAG: type 1 glutamine amidotransferase [Spirochaetota bacterium]